MELRHIHSFLVLAEELHFGRAAARLHISQPSLSLQLQQLERRLGVQLVARTSHSVRLIATIAAASPLASRIARSFAAHPGQRSTRILIGARASYTPRMRSPPIS